MPRCVFRSGNLPVTSATPPKLLPPSQDLAGDHDISLRLAGRNTFAVRILQELSFLCLCRNVGSSAGLSVDGEFLLRMSRSIRVRWNTKSSVLIFVILMSFVGASQ
jgi:hypothetical protein